MVPDATLNPPVLCHLGKGTFAGVHSVSGLPRTLSWGRKSTANHHSLPYGPEVFVKTKGWGSEKHKRLVCAWGLEVFVKTKGWGNEEHKRLVCAWKEVTNMDKPGGRSHKHWQAWRLKSQTLTSLEVAVAGSHISFSLLSLTGSW